jgi:hypothetical protein
MTKADRDALIRVARSRAKQTESEADTRAKTLLAEVLNDMTAEYAREDALFHDAVTIAEEAAKKANAQIAARCAELGIPASHSPRVHTGWQPRSSQFADRDRRAELRKLAEARLAALTQTAKTMIRGKALDIEEQLILGALESNEAREVLAAMPSVEELMPSLTIDDLGVTRWQPPEDAAAQLTTPMSATDRRRRQIRRAIEANPDASDRRIAEIAGCDHETIASYRPGGESGGELPSQSTDFSSLRERLEGHGD